MRFIIVLLLLFIPPQVLSAEEIQYSAIVMDITGEIEVQRGGEAVPVDLGAVLYPGDTVNTSLDASITVNYPESGREEQWPGDMKFIVGKKQSKGSSSEVSIRNRKIVLPQIESPQQGKLKLRSFERIQSMEVKGFSNSRTLHQRPSFSWNSIRGADTYKVQLYLDSEDKPLWSGTSIQTEIAYPDSEPPLNYGGSYEWELEAFRKGKTIALKNSVFDLPAKKELTIIREQKKKFEAQLLHDPKNTSTRLAFIFFLEHHRLYDDALQQYEVIRKVHQESEFIRKREERLLQIRSSNSIF